MNEIRLTFEEQSVALEFPDSLKKEIEALFEPLSQRASPQDRRPGEILAEIEALVAQGVVEVTLLGQNVNTYGVEFGDRFAFGKLLRACGEIEGLERVRFTARTRRRSPTTSSRPWRRRRTSCPACTCRCSPAPTVSSRRCGAATGARGSSGSSTGSVRRCRTPRSPPTSSSASPGRPRRTSPRRSASSRRPGSRAPSPSSTRSAPAPRRHDGAPGAQGGRPGAVRPAHRPPGGGLVGGEPGARGP